MPGITGFIPKGVAIHRAGPSDLPQGAVLLSKQEVYNAQMDLIKDWRPRNQVWSFIHGTALLGVCAGASGFLLTAFLRRKLRLMSPGTLSTFAAAVPIPAAMTVLMQHQFVTQNILIQDFSCPSCAQIRASMIQAAMGYLQPLILSTCACAALAKSTHTAYIPPVSRPVELFKTLSEIMKPFRGTLTWLLVVNVAAAVAVTHAQIWQTPLILDKLSKGDRPEQ